jgi:hypothetical protein
VNRNEGTDSEVEEAVESTFSEYEKRIGKKHDSVEKAKLNLSQKIDEKEKKQASQKEKEQASQSPKRKKNKKSKNMRERERKRKAQLEKQEGEDGNPVEEGEDGQDEYIDDIPDPPSENPPAPARRKSQEPFPEDPSPEDEQEVEVVYEEIEEVVKKAGQVGKQKKAKPAPLIQEEKKKKKKVADSADEEDEESEGDEESSEGDSEEEEEAEGGGEEESEDEDEEDASSSDNSEDDHTWDKEMDGKSPGQVKKMLADRLRENRRAAGDAFVDGKALLDDKIKRLKGRTMSENDRARLRILEEQKRFLEDFDKLSEEQLSKIADPGEFL